MLGTVIEGTRSAAIDIIVGAQTVAVHKSFGPGQYIEFDAHKGTFVDESGNCFMNRLLLSSLYDDGWREWCDADDVRADEYELSQQGKKTLIVIPADTEAYIMKKDRILQVTIVGYKHTHTQDVFSTDYEVKYHSTGCKEWIDGIKVFKTKAELLESL